MTNGGKDILETDDPVIAIGIDQSLTNTGFVVLHSVGGKTTLREHGVFKPAAGPDAPAARLREIADFFRGTVEDYTYVDAVAIEGYSRGSLARREEAGELGGLLRVMVLALQESRKMGQLYVVAPGTLKKFACGKGNVGKVEVALGAARKWPDLMVPNINTEHETDALVLAMVAMLKSLYSQLPIDRSRVEGMLSYETEILERIEPAKL